MSGATPAVRRDAPVDNVDDVDGIDNQLLEVAEHALACARQHGADMSEVAVGIDRGVSVTARNREMETIEHHRDNSLAVSVYFDHRSGAAASADFSADAIAKSVAQACAIAKFTERDECNGLADRARLAEKFPALDLYFPHQPDIDDSLARAVQCESAALDYHADITNSEGATASWHQEFSLYANSHDFRGLARGSSHDIACSVIAGRGERMQRDYWYDTARDAGDLQAPAHIGERAAQRTLRRCNARKVRTGQYPIIFEPGVSAGLLGHLVGAISGASLYRKASFLLDALGKQIFAESIRIHERPHLPKSPGAASFDNEGVATAPRNIVEDGVLRGYVLNSYAARRLAMQSTANAGGVHNLEIAPTGEQRLPDFVAQLERGLVISELIGFGVNTVTGDYSRGAFGYWVERGEIQHAVHEFTIAGNLAQMFRDIVAVGADIDARRNLRAGAILIDKMTVGGS